MKEINLISILGAFKNLSSDLFQSYLNYYGINIKDDELHDLEVLVDQLQSISKSITLFDKYFIGYSIPQIGKEFDLLRIDEESIVNIELKNNSTADKIKAQLIRNMYYLGFLKRRTIVFSFIANQKKLYTIDEHQNLVEVNLKELLTALVPQKVEKILDLDAYFNPSNYLVSPFNSTEEFVKRKYFLTLQQEKIKKAILSQLDTSNCSIISIKGKAGTGKTLLTYDIANEVSRTKEVLIVHCGYLNQGHITLRDNYGWKITEIRFLLSQDLSKYNLVVIDEAQRIYPQQLNWLITEVKKISNNCIFSYDEQQKLRRGEIMNNVEGKIEGEVTTPAFELTTKIRTNKEVASFIRSLFDKYKPPQKYKYDNIDLNYFKSPEEAKDFLLHLKPEDWKVINYTPAVDATHPYEKYRLDQASDNAHTVIGQEFNNVIAVLDEHFYYKKGTLSTRNYEKFPYYHPTKMLFQIVSRARIKLGVVIINNPEILKRCLEILK